MTTSQEDSRDTLHNAALLLLRVGGEAAEPALALLSSPSGPPGAATVTPQGEAVYALVDLGRPEGELIGAARVTAGDNGVRHLALCVAPPYRGRGLGRRILGEVLDVLRSEGVARVDTDVGASLSAARLCQQHGFRPVDGVAGRLALDL